MYENVCPLENLFGVTLHTLLSEQPFCQQKLFCTFLSSKAHMLLVGYEHSEQNLKFEQQQQQQQHIL